MSLSLILSILLLNGSANPTLPATNSLLLDTSRKSWPAIVVTSWPDSLNFPWTSKQTKTLVIRHETPATYATSSIFDEPTVGHGTQGSNYPFNEFATEGRNIFIYRASELQAAGVKPAAIYGLRFDVERKASDLIGMKIRMENTSRTVVDPSMVRDTGFQLAYYSRTAMPGQGQEYLYFFHPFVWDGVSNIAFDLSFTNSVFIAGNGQGTFCTNSHFASGIEFDNILSARGGTLSFSGTEVAPLLSTYFDSISTAVTVSAWVRGEPPIGPGATDLLLDGNGAKHESELQIRLRGDSGDVSWMCGSSGGAIESIHRSIVQGEAWHGWNNWTFTKNCSTGSMKIYLNGVLWHSGTGFHAPIQLSRMNLGRSLTNLEGFSGQVFQVGIWNRELDPASIRAVMNYDSASQGPYRTGLIGYYPLTTPSNMVIELGHLTHTTLLGPYVMKRVHGEDLFCRYAIDSLRPNIAFLQSAIPVSPTITDVYTTDTLMDHAHAIIRYRLITQDSVQPIDTMYGWLGTHSQIVDESGNVLDSIPVAAEDTARMIRLVFNGMKLIAVDVPSAMTYPNPAINRIQIAIVGIVPSGEYVELVDEAGRVVLHTAITPGESSELALDVSSLPRAPYFLRSGERNSFLPIPIVLR